MLVFIFCGGEEIDGIILSISSVKVIFCVFVKIYYIKRDQACVVRYAYAIYVYEFECTFNCVSECDKYCVLSITFFNSSAIRYVGKLMLPTGPISSILTN